MRSEKMSNRKPIWLLSVLCAVALWLLVTFVRVADHPRLEDLGSAAVKCGADLDLVEPIIFSDTFPVQMNNSLLLDYIRYHRLQPPFPVPYNLEHPNDDPSRNEGQNKFVLELLKNKRNGIFVEAGANDGEFLSTTLLLERDYGWTGILVEPDANAFEVLKSKGRKAWLADVCLSPSTHPQKVTFLQNKRTSTWSKVLNVSEHHKTWAKSQIAETTVKCLPFYSLLLALGIKEVDYFSLDVEGAEVKVLKTIPFDAIRIRVLSIEFDHIRLEPGADEALKDLMATNGYRMVTELQRGNAMDYIYAHSSVYADLPAKT